MPSFSRTRTPCSWYSCRVSQKLSLSLATSASTAPPMKTMSLRVGGSSTRIFNFCQQKSTNITGFFVKKVPHMQLGRVPLQRSRQIQLLQLPLQSTGQACELNVKNAQLQNQNLPGNMVDPPDRTICLKSSLRRSMSAVCIDWNVSSATPRPSLSTRWG